MTFVNGRLIRMHKPSETFVLKLILAAVSIIKTGNDLELIRIDPRLIIYSPPTGHL